MVRISSFNVDTAWWIIRGVRIYNPSVTGPRFRTGTSELWAWEARRSRTWCKRVSEMIRDGAEGKKPVGKWRIFAEGAGEGARFLGLRCGLRGNFGVDIDVNDNFFCSAA